MKESQWDIAIRPPMKAVATTVINDLRFYIADDGAGTDIKESAREFRDLTDASLYAVKANKIPGWSNFGIRWSAGYLFSDGTFVPPPAEGDYQKGEA